MTQRFLNGRWRITVALLLISSLKTFGQNAPTGGSSEIGIAIRPATFDFHANKGETIVTSVSVTNSQNKPMQIKLALGDWVRDSIGDHRYAEPGTMANSCAKWVKLSQSFVEIPPNGTSSFNLTFAVPDADSVVKQMRWAMLFVEFAEERTIPESSQKGVTTMLVKKQRLGLHIYQTPPAVHQKEIKMLDFKPVTGKKNTYRLSVKNTGDVQVSAKSYLELTAMSETGVDKKIEADAFPMFPGQVRIVDITLPGNLPKGKYNVIAAVDGGEDLPLEAAQEEIEVK